MDSRLNSVRRWLCPVPSGEGLVNGLLSKQYLMSEEGELEKYCAACDDYYPADTEFWYLCKSHESGLDRYCKACCQALYKSDDHSEQALLHSNIAQHKAAQAEESRQQKLVKSATQFAKKGKTLKQMAESLALDYGKLKNELRQLGYSHPRGIALHQVRIEHYHGQPLRSVVIGLVEEGLGICELAKKLKMDSKTLKTYAEKEGITLNKHKPIPKNFKNIIKATRKRQSERTDLIWIEYKGKRKYLAQWADELGICRATIKQRLEAGWPIEDVFSPVKTFVERSSANTIEFNGEINYLAAWSRKLDIGSSTIQKRLNLGYPVEEAFTAPLHSRRGFSGLNSLKSK